MLPASQINTLDPNALASLRRQARDNSPEALAAVARQFEALFLQMVLKSMRDATPSSGLTDNDQTRLYQSLLDQQLAQNLAQGGGTGLAQALLRQLGGGGAGQGGGAGPDLRHSLATVVRQPARTAGASARAESPAVPETVGGPGEAAAGEGAASAGVTARLPAGARDFVARLWPHAAEASRATGIPAHFMIAQAALETGWGRAELRLADGRTSHNLFNIKAGRGWEGATVSAATTEYADGQPVTETARFRAYGSYAEAFRDYARLLTSSPRYAEVLGASDPRSFARGLQQAGYATDPMYADKLTRIIGGATLRAALGS
jgi:flagellar protein FlgJ